MHGYVKSLHRFIAFIPTVYLYCICVYVTNCITNFHNCAPRTSRKLWTTAPVENWKFLQQSIMSIIFHLQCTCTIKPKSTFAYGPQISRYSLLLTTLCFMKLYSNYQDIGRLGNEVPCKVDTWFYFFFTMMTEYFNICFPHV